VSLKPYPRYRDTRIEWLGRIPIEWSVTPLRHLASITTGGRDTADAVPDGAYPFVVRSPHLEQIDTYTYDAEAILTAGDGDVGEVFHHLDGKFDVHQRVYVLHRFKGVSGRFLYYYFSSEFRNVVAYGGALTTVASLRRPMFTAFQIAAPAYADQLRIAHFLDRETAEIDAFIADQEELIALLAERRRSALDAAFGAARSSPQIRLQYVFTPERVEDMSNEEVLSVFRDFGVVPKTSRKGNNNKTPDDVSRYQLVRPGYLVVNRMKAWQGSLGVSEHRGIVSPDYEVLRPVGNSLLPRFAHHFLRSPGMVSQYAVNSTGIRPSQWRLYWDQMGTLLMPVPDHDLQREICDRIDETNSEIDAALADAREAIALSKERRAALISAAVTGKIDVRNHGGAE
jgi:type I restriction enzyme S subunit